MFRRSLIILAVVVSGCGGGGGGSPMNGMMDTEKPEPMMPNPGPSADMQTSFSGTKQQGGGVPGRYSGSLADLVGQSSGPVFGSVVQNIYTAGLSSVSAVDTTFTGDRFTLRVSRQDGSSFNLDTDRDVVALTNELTPSTNPVTNRPGAEGYIARESGGTFTAAGASVEWASTDYTDYLAGGYWLYIDTVSNNAEIGAFIDGPAFEDLTHSLPVTDTATYAGRAGGIYVASTAPDAASPGALEEGEYDASARLTANFGTMQIEGTVNDVYLYDVNGIITATGQSYSNPERQQAPYELSLQPAAINANGTFGGSNMSMTHPDLTITSTTGSWAGRFSNMNDTAGNPRAVAGTNAVYFKTAGGTEAVFTGAFYGATKRFP